MILMISRQFLVEFPSLENLKLSSIGIERIWPEQRLSMASYGQIIKSLSLEGCNHLKFLFSSSMVKSFVQLQHLELCNCESMEWVIDTKRNGRRRKMSFTNLFFLQHKDLPKLTIFGTSLFTKPWKLLLGELYFRILILGSSNCERMLTDGDFFFWSLKCTKSPKTTVDRRRG
ncbi:Disease resistance protein [Melia azedarach]|uniref:Disease resistance protein n=1 Tax=Melia azedarach TaxID=155640 RepID=A0ACC1X0N7_MELAZ|nr:Disease resistance protein [Melia azedarach]